MRTAAPNILFQMSDKIRLLTTFVCLVSVKAQSSVLEQHQGCVDRWKANQPGVAERFTDDQIAWYCQNSENWMQSATDDSGIRNDDILTVDEKDWIKSLRECNSLDCLSRIRCSSGKCSDTPTEQPPAKRPPSGLLFGRADATRIDEMYLDAQQPSQIQISQIASSEGSQTDKLQLALICIRTLQTEDPDVALPRFSGRPKEKVQAFQDWKKTCNDLKTQVESQGRTLEDLADAGPDLDVVDVNVVGEEISADQFLLRSQVVRLCLEFLDKRSPEDGFASYRSALADATDDEIQAKFARWHQKCRHIQKRLQLQGKTLNDFLNTQSAQTETSSSTANGQQRPRPGWTPTVTNTGGKEKGGRAKRQAPQAGNDSRAVRREYRMMSDEERERFHAAMNKLKTTKVDTDRTKYDLLTIYHTPQESPGAHWGPAFLPFHRDILKQLEFALRSEDFDLAVPYWDSTLDRHLPNPADSILWTKDFFGTGKGEVVEGPYANWQATHELSFVPGMRTLYRDVGGSTFGELYKEEDIEFAMQRQKYDELTACVDPTFELVHGVVHMHVGGYMADIGISPNDPTFYFHHCFMDYVLEEFRQIKQTRDERESQYPADDKACSNFHYRESSMQPFPIKNVDGLKNQYTDDLYYYEPRPTCSDTVPDCASQYLFCDTNAYRCMSKIVEGGNCTGFENTAICYGGSCVQGRCVRGGAEEPNPPITGQPPTQPQTTRQPVTQPPATTQRSDPVTQPPTPPDTTQRDDPTTRPPVTTTTEQQQSTTTPYPQDTTPDEQHNPTIAPENPTTTERVEPATTPGRDPPATQRPPSNVPLPNYVNPIPWDTVWFSITVIRGQYGYYTQPVLDAIITSCGKNEPQDYQEYLPGEVASGSEYPRYTGSSLVQIRDPNTDSSRFKVVKASVEVMDGQGNPCKAMCYNTYQKKYAECDGIVRVSLNSYYTQITGFKADKEEALKSGWVTEGYTRKHNPDHLLFQC